MITGYALKRRLLKSLRQKNVDLESLEKTKKIKFPKTNVSIIGTSTKIRKNLKKGSFTGIVYLSPSKESIPFSGKNLCPAASKGCSSVCLGKTSGSLRWNLNSKLWKTLLFVHLPEIFFKILEHDIRRLRKTAINQNLVPSIRLNGTSDVAWEVIRPQIFEMFHDVVFYDYTKIKTRYLKFIDGKFPTNYTLTFSRSENNEKDCLEALKKGGACAIVFENLKKAIKTGYLGIPVCNGDLHDYRIHDKPGKWIGLSFKGNKKDHTDFVVKN